MELGGMKENGSVQQYGWMKMEKECEMYFMVSTVSNNTYIHTCVIHHVIFMIIDFHIFYFGLGKGKRVECEE